MVSSGVAFAMVLGHIYDSAHLIDSSSFLRYLDIDQIDAFEPLFAPTDKYLRTNDLTTVSFNKPRSSPNATGTARQSHTTGDT
jgi:hypothetical protein